MNLLRRVVLGNDVEERPSLFGRILKSIFYAAILALYLFFFWRMCTRGDTELAKTYLWTDTARSAYTENATDFSVLTQEPKSEIAEATTKKKNDFALAISSIYYTPVANQLQFTLRYNDSMAESVAAEYDLASVPEGDFFVFVLADNLGTVYTDYQYLSDQRNVNNYRRLVFEDIAFSDEITEYFVSVYYIGSVEIEKPLLTLSVWNTERESTRFTEYPEPARAALVDAPTYTVLKKESEA